ncbi:phosphotransferase [Nocardiopsis sp. CA-288880]|uniref:phosphotransferase n=1 Tax=Nocardiopsis sp. CA-288880 TaxID=3239995 RepID=UPI003D95B16A
MKYTEQDLHQALDRLALVPDGPERIGYAAATVTGPARTAKGDRVWVRVGTVADSVVWMRPDAIEEAAAQLGHRVPMPRLLDSATWDVWDVEEDQARQARAHVFERVAGSPPSADPALTCAPDVDDTWWKDLRAAHDEIASAGWAGPGRTARRVRRWVAAMAGDRYADVPITWVPSHCDFHWSNLLSPRLTVLDWEGFSLAPAGTDAATLLTYSLAVPSVAARVRDLFSDVLSGDTGQLALLFAAAEVWTAVQDGHHPHLADPLRAHVADLLA